MQRLELKLGLMHGLSKDPGRPQGQLFSLTQIQQAQDALLNVLWPPCVLTLGSGGRKPQLQLQAQLPEAPPASL